MSVTKNLLYVNDAGTLNKATAANLDNWLINLQLRVDQLETKVNEKDAIIAELQNEIKELKTSNETVPKSATQTGFAWSNLFKNTSNDSLNVIMAKVSNENREKERIENNIMISGVSESETRTEDAIKKHDEEEVDKILQILELSRDEIKKQTRMKKNPSKTTEPANASKDPTLMAYTQDIDYKLFRVPVDCVA